MLAPGEKDPLISGLLVGSSTAFAHCNTLDGPVVAAARKALDTGNVNLILVWVQKKDEGEIRNMFQKAVAVRKTGGQAKELADMYFFETLVRIHRAGKLQDVAQLISKRREQGLHRDFENMMKKKHNPDDVAAARAFASAYVKYTHYVERLYNAAETLAPGHVQKEAPGLAHSH